MNTHLEDRLSAALTARAEQVTPESLRAPDVPATVSPLRRRSVTGAAILGAAAAVAAVVGLGMAVTGDERGPEPAGTPSATDTAPAPPITTPGEDPGTLRGLLPEADIASASVGSGTLETSFGGARVTLEADGRMVVRDSGLRFEGRVPDVDGQLSVRKEILPLGQAGSGFVVIDSVADGQEEWNVMVPTDEGLVRASPADVPLATGFVGDVGYVTWTDAYGNLFTREMVGNPSEQRYRVYRWEVSGPGEGGTGPDSPDRDLAATDLGVVCFDFVANTAERC